MAFNHIFLQMTLVSVVTDGSNWCNLSLPSKLLFCLYLRERLTNREVSECTCVLLSLREQRPAESCIHQAAWQHRVSCRDPGEEQGGGVQLRGPGKPPSQLPVSVWTHVLYLGAGLVFFLQVIHLHLQNSSLKWNLGHQLVCIRPHVHGLHSQSVEIKTEQILISGPEEQHRKYI